MCDSVNKFTDTIDLKLIKDINNKSETFLNKNKAVKDRLIKEFNGRLRSGYKTIMSKKVKYYYQYVREDNESYGKYYVTDGLNNTKVILDCEKLSKGSEFWKLDEMTISQDETFLVFSLDVKGDGLCDIYIKSFFSDDLYKIKNKKEKNLSGNLAISYDNNKVYYVASDKDIRSYKLYCYNISTKENVLIYHEKVRQFGVYVYTSSENSKLLLSVGSYSSTEIYEIIDDKLVMLFGREVDVKYSVDYYINEWYVLKCNKGITTLSKYDDECFKQQIIINKKGFEIEEFYIAFGYIFISFLHEGNTKICIMSLQNYKIMSVQLIDNIYDVGFPSICNMNVLNPIVVMEYTSYLKPSSYVIINLDNLNKQIEITNQRYYRPKQDVLNYVENKYRCVKLDVNNKGLRVTLIFNNEVKGKCRKCVLYGYGSYRIKMNPFYSEKVTSLLDRGYIYCIAHIRGGGENGYSWYDKGRLLNKKNTFNDYIECAEFLINNGVTEPSKLVGIGASAGGLLMGAVINMRPELFNLVIMGVPFVNVLSEMCNDKKALTTEEYIEWGNPKVKKYYNYMKDYCPYANIDLKKNYPNLYIYSNINDSLVDYRVPYNYYLKIREAEVYKNKLRKVFLNIKLKYGHKGSSDYFEKHEEDATIDTIILSIN